MNSFAVIIPSRNIENLLPCMDRIRELHFGVRFIVIDDKSRGQGLGTQVAKEQLVETAPFIYARNINLGIEWAGTDDVILLNDDTLLQTTEGFRHLQECADANPDYGVIAARTDAASCPLQTAEFSGLREASRAVAFVCVYIPRRVIDKVGLLDQRFTGEIDGEMVYGGEDDDYCYRVRQAGFKIGVLGDVFVNHTTLESTFRGQCGSLPVNATRARFREIHGFEMGTR